MALIIRSTKRLVFRREGIVIEPTTAEFKGDIPERVKHRLNDLAKAVGEEGTPGYRPAVVTFIDKAEVKRSVSTVKVKSSERGGSPAKLDAKPEDVTSEAAPSP